MSERSESPSEDRNFGSRSKHKKTNKHRATPSEKISESGQSKITHFFKSRLERKKVAPTASQTMMMTLEDQLALLNEEEQELQAEHARLVEQQSTFRKDCANFSDKSKELMRESLKAIYKQKRQQKGRIDPAKGFFTQNFQTFVAGEYGQDEFLKLTKLRESLAECQKQDQKTILYDCLREEQKKWRFIELQIKSYKQRLKICHEEEQCMFGQTWPLIGGRYQLLQLIGRGGFSEVYRAYDLTTDQYVALKYTSFKGIDTSHAHYVIREYENHKKLSHCNIAKLFDVIDLGSEGICIAIEFCSGPELSYFMKLQGQMSEDKAKSIMLQILKALEYLNSVTPRIIHYDLKPQNIMFEKGEVKILDFGLSKQIDSEQSRVALTTHGMGTYWYLPPESFNDKNPGVSGKVDIWSAGIIFFEMLYAQKPFGNNMSQRKILKEGTILNAFEVVFPERPGVSEGAKDLIRRCLAYHPEDRLDPLQAVHQPYFN